MKILKASFATIVLQLIAIVIVHSQTLKSPAEFLGYSLGDRFSYHHKVVEYVRHVANNSERVELKEYGKTYENRDLLVAVISSPENLQKLESLRANNLKRAQMEDDIADQDDVVFCLV